MHGQCLRFVFKEGVSRKRTADGHDEPAYFITENPWGDAPEVDITFKTRHQPHFMKGRLHRAEHGYRLESPERIQGIAPGQFGVVYDAAAEICIGSGEIGV